MAREKMVVKSGGSKRVEKGADKSAKSSKSKKSTKTKSEGVKNVNE